MTQGAREGSSGLTGVPDASADGTHLCGDCGGPLVRPARITLCCSAARRLGTCKQRQGHPPRRLEGLILDALKHNLMHPDLVAEFIREFYAEINRHAATRKCRLAHAPRT